MIYLDDLLCSYKSYDDLYMSFWINLIICTINPFLNDFSYFQCWVFFSPPELGNRQFYKDIVNSEIASKIIVRANEIIVIVSFRLVTLSFRLVSFIVFVRGTGKPSFAMLTRGRI